MEYYKTSDMAMVTFLKLGGHQVQRVRWEVDICWWYFQWSQLLEEQVDIFMGKLGKVEPTEYNRVFGMTKREFYEAKPKAS